ncbi:helix-turn-helix transcriptional regulator [Eggerthellaceae bacterium 24-137]
MVFESRKLFPVRLFGFSMFWAWLFLVAVSPSPAFGQLCGPSDAPFEIPELLFRILVLGVVLALRVPLASVVGKRALLAVSVVAGTGTVALLAISSGPLAATVASALAALAEVSMFLMWLCFFGYMRLDETLKLIVLSYAGGSIICLATSALPSAAAITIAVLLPVASGLSFLLSERHYQAQRGSKLFVDVPNVQKALPHMPRSIWLMTIALALISLAFAWLSAVALLVPERLFSGPLVQSGCSLVATLLVLAICTVKPLKAKLYGLYRGIPLLTGGGFCLLLVSYPGLPLLGSCAVVFAFLLFEALSLNDYCNVVKTDDSSLLATMVIARLAASLGMLAGWTGAEAACSIGDTSASIVATVIIGVLIALCVGTLVFTDKSIEDLKAISFGRAMLEKAEEMPAREQIVTGFAERHGLSKRETEVLDYLLAGRTTQYISEKLFISDSTARSHVHKIYQKTETHTRMELIDGFESYQAKFIRSI